MVALAGCGDTTIVQYVPLNPPPHSIKVRDPATVRMFTSRPGRPFVDVGEIQSRPGLPSADGTPEIYAKMRQKAGELGCDGLVLLGVQGSGAGLFRASCIVFSDAEKAPENDP
jgi:hypothetical protein